MSAQPTASALAVAAAVPVRMRALLDGPARSARLLGAFRTAAYFAAGDDVIALLTADGVALPCGLVLPWTSAESSLSGLRGPAVVGDGTLAVAGLRVRAGRLVTRAVPRLGLPAGEAVRAADRALGPLREVTSAELAALPDPAAARRLLGRGSGLTPSGDDVLAGYLAAAAAFDRPAGGLRRLVAAEATRRTTTLSAALLRHAAAGEAIPQLTALLRALATGTGVPEAAGALARVGHTSGRALAAGALAAVRGETA